MENSIYKQMSELQEIRDSNDVAFLGAIQIDEIDTATKKQVKNTYDIFVSLEDGPYGPIFKFYNKDKESIAVNLNDGRGTLPTSKFVDKLPPESLKELDEFSYLPENSLNKVNYDLEQVEKALGIPKEKIRAMSEVSGEKEKTAENQKDDDKIHLKDEKEDGNLQEANKEKTPEEEKKLQALEKQQTSLSQKVDDRHTLGELLGVPGSGTLVAVYSDSIENGSDKNSTKFSFLIKDKDGNYTECPNIEQVGGTTPDAQVAASSYDGSDVQTSQVNSLYRIKSSSNIEYMLTAKIASQGTIDLGIGQRDRTQGVNSQNLTTVTTPLKTTSTYYTTTDTREAINDTRDGNKQATRRAEEGQTHIDANCEHSSKDEFDGDRNTGHAHDEEENEIPEEQMLTDRQLDEIAQKILDENPEIDRVFTQNEVKERFLKNYKDSNNKKPEEIAENTAIEMEQDASHIPTRTL